MGAIAEAVIHLVEPDEALRARLVRALEEGGFAASGETDPGDDPDQSPIPAQPVEDLPAAAAAILAMERADYQLERLHAAALGQLTGSFVHELRNALTGIRCYFELLEEAALPANVTGFIGEVESGLERMTGLTSEWVDLVHGRGASACPNLELRRLVTLLQSTGACRRVEIELDLDEQAAAVAVPGVRLQSLLFVLLSELISRAPERIAVSTRCEGENIVVRLQGEGAGVPRQWVEAEPLAKDLGARLARLPGGDGGFEVAFPAAPADDSGD